MDRRAVWLSGSMMGALGALLGLREAGARLVELAARSAGFGGGPTPRALDWIAATAPAQRWLAAADRWLALAAAVLAITLAWRLARRLNPHGTLVAAEAPVGAGSRPTLQTPLAPMLVRRSFAAALLTAYLLGAMWPLVYEELERSPPFLRGLPGLASLWPARPWAGLAAAFLLGGAALWLLWGEWGAVTPRQARSSSPSGTLACGLLAGAAALPALLPLTVWGRDLIDSVLAAVGPADPAPWRLALWGVSLGLPAAFFALGLLGHALARPAAAAARSRAFILLPALLLALVGAGEAYFYTAVAVGRYDYGRDLAALVGASRRPSSARVYLIFPPRPVPSPLPGLVPYMSIQELDAGHDSPRRTWEYLRRRKFQCAAAGDAFIHLHDCASLRWDSAESLRVDLANLEHNPQPVFAGLLVAKLFTCATSPANHALLRQAAEPTRFRPDPAWLRTLGLLDARFGDRAAGSGLLRQAGLGPAEIRQALGSAAPLTSGAVAGQIMVNGHPGAGLTVGLLPAGRWQTLVGTPRPFELRWVAAVAPADSEGRFRLRDLGEGTYLLIVMGDPQHLPLRGPGARADSASGILQLDGHHPTRDLGTIRIVTPRAPARRTPKVETG